MPKYRNKTIDGTKIRQVLSYQFYLNYGYGDGFEHEITEYTYASMMENKKAYLENSPGQLSIRHRWEPLTDSIQRDIDAAIKHHSYVSVWLPDGPVIDGDGKWSRIKKDWLRAFIRNNTSYTGMIAFLSIHGKHPTSLSVPLPFDYFEITRELDSQIQGEPDVLADN